MDDLKSSVHTTTSKANPLVYQVNRAVSRHLGGILGFTALETINFHLRKLVGTDLSQVGSEPKLVESGLRKLFGVGAQVIIEATIVGAFRSAHIIPERDFVSLEEAIAELYAHASSQDRNGLKSKA